MLGKDNTLDLGAADGKETEARELATLILDDPANEHLNATQIMLRLKDAFGTGIDPGFPDADTMNNFESNLTEEACSSVAPSPNATDDNPIILHTVCGDGSYTTPNNWWTSLAGFGGMAATATSQSPLWRKILRRSNRATWKLHEV